MRTEAQRRADEKYAKTPGRIAYRKQWLKKNTISLVGLRPLQNVEVLTDQNTKVRLTPTDFVYRHKGDKLYMVMGISLVVHFPRSLGRRVRLVVNKNTNAIIAETDKCFK